MPATQQGPVNVALTTTTLPNGFCPTSEQDRLDTFVSRTIGSLPGGYSTFVVGNALPAAIDRDKAWLRLNADGTIDRWYTVAQGAWLSPHRIPPNYVTMYWGDVSGIAAFDGANDGGTSATVTPTTGPFWEIVSEAVGRVPIHPDPTKTVIQFQSKEVTFNAAPTAANGGIGGEERHSLTTAEMPPHTHTISQLATGTIAFTPGTTLNLWLVGSSGVTNSTGGNSPTVVAPHNNMQPYLAIYFIRRTARLYYRINF